MSNYGNPDPPKECGSPPPLCAHPHCVCPREKVEPPASEEAESPERGEGEYHRPNPVHDDRGGWADADEWGPEDGSDEDVDEDASSATPEPQEAKKRCKCGHDIFTHGRRVMQKGDPLYCRECDCEEFEWADDAATPEPQEAESTMDDIPRRIRRDRWTPAETAIGEAINVVEDLPADERLTKAVVLLGEAKDAVADYVDGVEPQEAESGEGTDNIMEIAATLDETRELLRRHGADAVHEVVGILRRLSTTLRVEGFIQRGRTPEPTRPEGPGIWEEHDFEALADLVERGFPIRIKSKHFRREAARRLRSPEGKDND